MNHICMQFSVNFERKSRFALLVDLGARSLISGDLAKTRDLSQGCVAKMFVRLEKAMRHGLTRQSLPDATHNVRRKAPRDHSHNVRNWTDARIGVRIRGARTPGVGVSDERACS